MGDELEVVGPHVAPPCEAKWGGITNRVSPGPPGRGFGGQKERCARWGRDGGRAAGCYYRRGRCSPAAPAGSPASATRSPPAPPAYIYNGRDTPRSGLWRRRRGRRGGCSARRFSARGEEGGWAAAAVGEERTEWFGGATGSAVEDFSEGVFPRAYDRRIHI